MQSRDGCSWTSKSKTELVFICSKSTQSKMSTFSIPLDDESITASLTARNVCVIFDSSLLFEAHIRNIKCNFATLYQVFLVHCGCWEACACPCNISALLTVRLPVNSRWSRTQLPGCAHKLHKKNSHRPVLHSLHLLPVQYRITFKILLLTLKGPQGWCICQLLNAYAKF